MAANAEPIDWKRWYADDVYREQIDREDREQLRAWVEISPAVLEELKVTRLKHQPLPPEPEIDRKRWYADDEYREQIDKQERHIRRGSRLIEITRAELEQVKTEVAATPKPQEPEIDRKRWYADDEYHAAVLEQDQEQRRTAILNIYGDTMRAWVETKEEYATRTKREAAIDRKRWYADDAYCDAVREQGWQRDAEAILVIRLKDFERPKAAPSPS